MYSVKDVMLLCTYAAIVGAVIGFVLCAWLQPASAPAPKKGKK